jgi:hypothetical protein
MFKPTWALGVMFALVTAACKTAPVPEPAAPEPAKPEPVLEELYTEDEPAPTPLPPIPATPAKAPLELIATASAPAPASLVPMVAAYVDRVVPGAGQGVTLDVLVAASAAQQFDLRGVDLTKPVRALVLDPSRFSDPLVFVVAVADEGALAAQVKAHGGRYQLHRGFAAVGAEKTLIEAAPYALTTLVAAPLPPAPTLDLDVGYLMLHHGGLLEMLAGGASAEVPDAQRPMVEAMTKGFLSFLGQLERLQISAEIVGADFHGGLRFQPKPGTALAAFVAAQAPASFARLNGLTGPLLIGGHLDLKMMMPLMTAALEPMMSRFYGTAASTILDGMKRWSAASLGEIGGSFDIVDGKVAWSMIVEVSDPALITRLWAEQTAAQAKAKGGIVTSKVTTSTHRGVKLTSVDTRINASATPEERAAFELPTTPKTQVFGVVGKTAFMAMGDKPLARAKALVDGLKAGKTAAAQPAVARALDEARRRRESMVMTFDMSGMMAIGALTSGAAPTKPAAPPAAAGDPAVLAFGGAGGALAVRFTMPAAQVAQVAALRQAGAGSSAADIEAALKQLDDSANRLCACKDLTCAEKVMQDLATLKEPAGKPSQDDMNRAMAIAERMAACQAKLHGQPAP